MELVGAADRVDLAGLTGRPGSPGADLRGQLRVRALPGQGLQPGAVPADCPSLRGGGRLLAHAAEVQLLDAGLPGPRQGLLPRLPPPAPTLA